MPSCHVIRSTCVYFVVSGLIVLHPCFQTATRAQTRGKPIATQIGRFFGWAYSQGGYHSSSNGAAVRAQSRHHAAVPTYPQAVYFPGHIQPSNGVDSGLALPPRADWQLHAVPTPAYRRKPAAEPMPAPIQVEDYGSGVDSNRSPFAGSHPAEQARPQATQPPRPTATLGPPAPSAKAVYGNLQPLDDSPRIAPLPVRVPGSVGGAAVLPEKNLPATQPPDAAASEALLNDSRLQIDLESDLLLESDAVR